MRFLPFIILVVIISCLEIIGQSPHGDLKGLDCSVCHQSNNWKIDIAKNKFDHDKTSFKLTGQHKTINCISCHEKLNFDGTQSDCGSCHKDLHQNTVGSDCSTCHSPNTWLISTKNELHQKSRFPLLGSHLKAECTQCHSGYPNLNFTTLGIDCFDCHQADYQATKNPNHVQAGFSTDCLDCHSMLQNKWSAEIFAHNLFPLTGGHSVANCFSCHQSEGNFGGLSTDCYSCHQTDYQSTSNPPHSSGNFPTECKQCHTIQGWKPASFNHNATQFPLTGAHLNTNCTSCHQNGYVSMSTTCVSCHETNFNATTNPNHSALSIPNDCQNCHSTNSGWKPALFPIHNNYYQLIGAHAVIQNNCSSCHATGYTNTPAECYGCHQNDYISTINPPHQTSQFPTDCLPCHSQNAWTPATFDHDNPYFPIYSGKHKGKWNTCSDCHKVQSNYNIFSCIDCHEHRRTEMDSKHQGVSGYIYASTECFSCHPQGRKEGAFNHATSIFPLTGAHQVVDCSQCHQNGYANTTTNCFDCHQSHYNTSSNPNHTSLSISTDCASCHSTNADWKPAQFPQHDDYFPLSGAHAAASTDCMQCHIDNYSNIANTCVSCHQTAYNSAINPNHTTAGVSLNCEDCHNSSAWIPSSFSHASTGFNLQGGHLSIQCSSCHQNTTTGLNGLCVACHQADFNSAQNHLVQGYPNDCEMCHNSTAWNQSTFNHNNTNFQLTGAHVNQECSNCHSNGFTNTQTECSSCHLTDFNNSTNPNHVSLNISIQCQSCHTTNPGWKPATFSIHNNFFQLVGAHAAIQNNCSSCHTTGYTNTPAECYGCHQNDYISTTNPPHQTSQFPIDCLPCHTQNAWTPATFDHDNPYFPIYSGKHKGKWNTCSDCHKVQSNYSIFTCIDCHEHRKSAMDSKHNEVNGYIYASIACLDCHPRGNQALQLQRIIKKAD